MKKLALLMVLVLVFSVSCVFATDATPFTLSGEIISGDTVAISGEADVTAPEDTVVVSGEDDAISGEIVDTDIDDTVDTNNTDEALDEDEEIESSDNSAIIGAIIAIVIVVAVVAIAAILRKD